METNVQAFQLGEKVSAKCLDGGRLIAVFEEIRGQTLSNWFVNTLQTLTTRGQDDFNKQSILTFFCI